jgi:hypothetical protein
MREVCIILMLSAPLIAMSQIREISVSGAVAKTQGSASMAVGRNWEFGKSKRFAVGTGLRFNAYFGKNQFYITAPAKLTSGSTGPLVIFKENIAANIDSFRILSPQVNSLNLFINLRYRISSKISAGFNIDALGFSFGTRKTGTYINRTEGKIVSEHGRPTIFNVLLISDNDRGTLSSELYLTYSINERWSAKLAANFLFTEYTTEAQLQQNPEPNDRFRNKSLMLGFGLVRKF